MTGMIPGQVSKFWGAIGLFPKDSSPRAQARVAPIVRASNANSTVENRFMIRLEIEQFVRKKRPPISPPATVSGGQQSHSRPGQRIIRTSADFIKTKCLNFLPVAITVANTSAGIPFPSRQR
jgi:hypothetical protein